MQLKYVKLKLKCGCSALKNGCPAFISLQWNSMILTFMFLIGSETLYDSRKVFISLNKTFFWITDL